MVGETCVGGRFGRRSRKTPSAKWSVLKCRLPPLLDVDRGRTPAWLPPASARTRLARCPVLRRDRRTQLLAWVEQTLGRRVRVVGWKRLTGGLTSIVHRLTVRRNGRREEYVLRWWVPDSEWEQWIARAVPLETAVLSWERATRTMATLACASVDSGSTYARRTPGSR